MITRQTILALACAASVGNVSAQVTITVTQGEETDLAALYGTADLIQGLIPEVLPGDRGWHPVNTDPLDQLPAFTDGQGIRASGLTGLLNDFPEAGLPAKLIRYALPVPADINEIRVFTGNNDRDGRVFHTYTVRFSSDQGATFTDPIYVQSHFSGTVNNLANNSWRVALSQLTDLSGPLAKEVSHLEFDFYAVDNTGGQMRDPFDGINPFNETDDGLTAAFVSPLVWEIDVLGRDNLPRLTPSLSGTDLQLLWLSRASGFVVQSATNLNTPTWTDLDPQPVINSDGIHNATTVTISNNPQFFRLRTGP